MRAKGEVLRHLVNNGYSNNAITKITGFLIGKGLKEPNELITFKKGEKTWDEFIVWFENKPTKRPKTIYDVFEAAFELKESVKQPSDTKNVRTIIDFLVEEYVFDTTTTQHVCENKNSNR